MQKINPEKKGGIIREKDQVVVDLDGPHGGKHVSVHI